MIHVDHSVRHYGHFYDSISEVDGPEKKEKTSPPSFLKPALIISGVGVVLGGAAALAYQAHSKDRDLIAGLYPVSGNCSKAADTVGQLFYARNQNQLLNDIFHQCPDHKVSAASCMSVGDSKDDAYQELFTDAVKNSQHVEALDYVQQIGKIPLKDQLLQKLGHASSDLKEKIFDQMSTEKRKRAYEGWVRSLIEEGKEWEGVEMLEKKILSPDERYHMQYEAFYRVRDLDLRAQLAQKLPDGDEKDRAYRIVTEHYVSANRCTDALAFAKKVNFDGANQFGDMLDARIHSSEIDQIRRSAKWGSKLEKAIYAQHERLDHVADCHEGEVSTTATEAKASTAPIAVNNVALGLKIVLEIGRQVSEAEKTNSKRDG